METFKNCVGFESILVRLSGAGVYSSLDPVSNLLVGVGSQSGHRMVFLIDAIKQIACQDSCLSPLVLQEVNWPQMWKWHNTSQ